MHLPFRIGRRMAASLVGLIVFAAGPVSITDARPVLVRIGTIALQRTVPYNFLQEMAETWKAAPDGGVRGTPFGGFHGGEDGIVSAIKQGQLHAALLTISGLGVIEPNVIGLQNIPMAYRTLEEAAFVRSKLTPKYEEQMAARGFVVLGWCDYGWWQIFSTVPIRSPEDLRGQKFVVASADDSIARIANALGTQPIALQPNDIYTGLQTGMVTTVPSPPFFALAGQMYRPAKHMLEINWAPLVGAIVISDRTWKQMSPGQQEVVRAAAVVACEKITADGRKEMQVAIDTMVQNGLTVQKVEGAAEATWKRFFENLYPSIRGDLVPATEFDQIMQLLREYRAQHGGAAP